jgi:DNA repair exonuclease SbcCD ATPase subunit
MQLDFLTIKWRNFLSTGKVPTTINLKKATDTLIVGENGAGKSTLIDALTFALYNRPFRDIGKPELVNSINGKDCVVELELTSGGVPYKIIRGIKPNLFEIYQNDNLVAQDAAIKDYQKWLETHVLKMNLKAFSQIVVLGSDSYIPFMRLKSGRRREVIEEILDIEIFSFMNAVLKRKVQMNRESLETNRMSMTVLEERLKTLSKHVEEIKDDKEARRTSYQTEIDKAEADNLAFSLSVQNNLDKLKLSVDVPKNLAALTNKRSEFKVLHGQINQKRNAANKIITFYEVNENCPTCSQDIESGFKAEEVRKHTHTVSEYNDALDKINTKISDIEVKIAALQVEVAKIDELKSQNVKHNTRIEGNKQYIKKLQKQLEDLDAPVVTQTATPSVSVDKVNQDIADTKKEREELIETRKYLDFAATLLRDDGIKTREIRRYLPLINTQINKHLQDMDCYVNFTLDENFEEIIKSRHRDKFTYNSFSAGERLRIDLALLFTWREVAARKNSVHTNLLIMDEVFDSSLDSQGTDEFLKIIKKLGANTNLFVISHRNEFLYDKFKSVIKFEKVHSFSQMST